MDTPSNRQTVVYVLHHVSREDQDDEDVKLIGVYSSEENAKAAIDRLGAAPGFRDCPEGFHVDRFEVDEDHWTEGFVTVYFGT
jgi:hypothetical protein